jgi:hypothetical protein
MTQTWATAIDGSALGEVEIDGRQCLVQLRQRRDAYEWHDRQVAADHPREDDLVAGRAGLLGHVVESGQPRRCTGVLIDGVEWLVVPGVGAVEQRVSTPPGSSRAARARS